MKKPSIWFWVVAGLFLLWNAFGCYLYIFDATASDAAYAEAYGQDLLALRDDVPAWSTAGYAIAVWGALVASVLLLLRRALAAPLFMVAFVGIVVGFAPVFLDSDFRAASGSAFWVMPLIVTGFGLVEIWFSRRERAKGTLR